MVRQVMTPVMSGTRLHKAAPGNLKASLAPYHTQHHLIMVFSAYRFSKITALQASTCSIQLSSVISG